MVPEEPLRRRRSSKEFKYLCERFEGGMESAARNDPECFTFLNLRVSVGKTSTSPVPTFGEGGKRKFRKSRINFPRSVMGGTSYWPGGRPIRREYLKETQIWFLIVI